jgi:thiol-disulfide isomerase/thioredoxin
MSKPTIKPGDKLHHPRLSTTTMQTAFRSTTQSQSILACFTAVILAMLLASEAHAQRLSPSGTRPPMPGSPAQTAKKPVTPDPNRPLLPLMVGTKAPAIHVPEWIKHGPIEGYEPGKTYVIDFWAVWCEGCVKTLPNLSLLQDRSNRTIISICIASGDAKGNTKEAATALIREKGEAITAHIGWDPDQRTLAQWLVPSGQSSIPLAYVVNGEGVVAYIGKPDDPDFYAIVEQIAKGQWNLQDAALKFDAQMRPKVLPQRISKATREKDWTLVLQTYEDLDALMPNAERQYGILKYLALVGLARSDEANALGQSFLQHPRLGRDGTFLNSLAWDIVDPSSLIATRDLDLALLASEQAVKITRERAPSNLHTFARVFFLRGDRAKAIETQTKAIASAKAATDFPPATLADYEATLKTYQDESNPAAPEPAPAANPPEKTGPR